MATQAKDLIATIPAGPAHDEPKWLTLAVTKPQAELLMAMIKQETLDAPEECEGNPHFAALYRRVTILLADFENWRVT